MKAPKNRRVYVIGYGAATALGTTFAASFERASRGDAGFRFLTRCTVENLATIVGEIPEFSPITRGLATAKELYNWNASFVMLTMAVCQEAIQDAKLPLDGVAGERTACLMGSAINGHDAFRVAMQGLSSGGPNKVSPYLLPNLCANVPSGKVGTMLGFTGPIVSPQSACASGNHAIALAARMIRDGDCDFALAGGADAPLLPEIIHGFANMNATLKPKAADRSFEDPKQASRPFSVDRRGFVLAEGAAALVLAADDVLEAHGLEARAEVLGIGWTSDAHHFTRPNAPTVQRAIREAIDDAGLCPKDIENINAHGTSTPTGDAVEIACLREVFGKDLAKIPVSANKSQVGHSLGAAAAIEAALAVEGIRQGIMLPTLNYVPDPELPGIDVVTTSRKQAHQFVLSNAFGFGGTNCCIVFKGV